MDQGQVESLLLLCVAADIGGVQRLCKSFRKQIPPKKGSEFLRRAPDLIRKCIQTF